jgi:hypothetical protein
MRPEVPDLPGMKLLDSLARRLGIDDELVLTTTLVTFIMSSKFTTSKPQQGNHDNRLARRRAPLCASVM